VTVTLHPALRNVDAVIFDVGGTLVHPDWQRLASLVEAETGMFFTREQMHAAFYAMLRVAEMELVAGANSTLPRGAHWTFFNTFRLLGIDDDACIHIRERMTAAHQERHLWCEPDAEAPSVLLLLKNAGLRIAVISNTEDGRVNDSLASANLADHFECLIDSHVVGCSKPDEAIFQLALKQLGVAPQRAAYVGDSYGYDVIGAHRAGLQPILLDRSDSYEEQSWFARITSLSELVEKPARP